MTWKPVCVIHDNNLVTCNTIVIFITSWIWPEWKQYCWNLPIWWCERWPCVMTQSEVDIIMLKCKIAWKAVLRNIIIIPQCSDDGDEMCSSMWWWCWSRQLMVSIPQRSPLLLIGIGGGLCLWWLGMRHSFRAWTCVSIYPAFPGNFAVVYYCSVFIVETGGEYSEHP